jgi:hypothetical protein
MNRGENQMKLRFSNGKSFEVTFHACDLVEFVHEGKAALRVFRAATQHRVHRGEIHKTVSEFDPCELHVQDRMGGWHGLGHIDPLDTKSSFGVVSIFSPFTIRFRLRADSLDDMHRLDAELFNRSAPTFWRGAVDSWTQSNNMHTMIQDIDDALNVE